MPGSEKSLPPSGPTLQQAFETLVDTLNQRGISYAIIGGIAVVQHTRVRTTDDIDALVAIPQVAMPGFFESLKADGFAVEITQSIRELRDDGLTSIRFQDVQIDLMRPVIPLYAHVLDRAMQSSIFGRQVRISSAEGLIAMKIIGFRLQDQADIKDLLAAYGSTLDFNFVRSELDAVLEPGDSRRVKLEEWIKAVVDS